MRNKWIVGIVLALVIIAGVVAAYKLTRTPKGAAGLSGMRIEATFLAYGTRPETAAEINVGGTMYDETGTALFTITKVTSAQAEEDSFDSQGRIHIVQHPILKDLTITAQSIAPKESWAFMSGADKVLAGASLALYGDTWKVWAKTLTVRNLP
ncbi:DUF4330 family protein [Candidatus Cryosericum odellii]|jgi:hypothetical protein|uniref:DUF4330 family protein n=2 Tax=Candidatus Cryosericum odellii TaxID=2290917 RepID=A0A398DGI8_9BACT|nr:DUF4330 family protein [Candidatus Cryosericum odellii]RIE11317.1 DUF4330 family protein [Candidatus Cryosericum odellii]